MNTKEIFIKRLKIAMEVRDVDSAELARLTGLSKVIVDRILTGETKNIRCVRVISFCLALKVSCDYLLGLSDKMEMKKQS